MKRIALAILFGAALAAAVMACSFASLDYLQNGPTEDSGGDVTVPVIGDEGGSGTLDAHVTPLAMGQTSPNLLAQDTLNLYWISGNDVMTVAKVGGAAHSIGQVTGVLELTADSDPAGAVYVVTGTNVVALQKQDGGMATAFSVEAGAPAPSTVLVDDTSLFILEVDDTDPTSSQIVKVPKAGGTAVTIASDINYPPQTLTLTASDVVWGSEANMSPSAFFELPKAVPGTSMMLMVDDSTDTLPASSRQLAASDTTIFWSDSTYLYARDRQPSSVTTTLYTSEDADDFSAVALDTTNLYALNNFGSSVMRVSLDGKVSARLVKDLTLPTSIVVDGTSVYVSVGPAASGQILKIDK